MKSRPPGQHFCEREGLAGEGIRPRITKDVGRWLIRFVVCAIWLAGIRARSESFTFSTLAGNAGYGIADGISQAARFNFPAGVAADAAGNVYVADTENSTIRRIDSS